MIHPTILIFEKTLKENCYQCKEDCAKCRFKATIDDIEEMKRKEAEE